MLNFDSYREQHNLSPLDPTAESSPVLNDEREVVSVEALNSGIQSAIDPVVAQKNKTGVATIETSSPWMYSKCEICQHSFKLDDKVLITEEGKIYHHEGILNCSSKELVYNEKELEDISVLYQGILEAYPAPPGLRIVFLQPDDPEFGWLLAPPMHNFERYKCKVCAHTLRPTDIVVLCPCFPENPQCRIAIHWDPFRGWNCWGEWDSRKKELFCPVTSAQITYGR